MIHKTLVVGPLQCNCAILGCEKTKEAVIIDPGDEPQKIIEEVNALGLTPKYLIHTHAHFDHIGGTKGVRAHFPSVTCLHPGDLDLYKHLPMQGQFFGMSFEEAPPIEKLLEDEELLSFGEHQLKVIHTPGHSPGGVCLHLDGILFSGDTIFRQSIGRTDLWGGDYSLLIRSIKSRLMTLDDEIKIFPGHGPHTRVGEEKRKNPFLN